MLANKRGQTTGWFWAVIFLLIVLGLLVLAYYLVGSGFFGDISQSATANARESSSFGNELGSSFVWMDYIFGGVSQYIIGLTSSTSAIVITIAIWLLIFLTFADVISTFSTFNKAISWIVAFLLAVIAANLKFVIVSAVLFLGLFSFLGVFAVLGGLVAAFGAFFAVNWGIQGLGPWIMRRKAFIAAEKASIKTDKGAKKVADAIEGMKKIGKSLGSP